MKNFISLGMLLIFIGMIFLIVGSLANKDKTDTKFFAGGMIGFIPFGFGNDKKMIYFGFITMAILFILIRILSKT